MGYAKLFSGILMSTLWSESSDTRVLFVTMLAAADSTGFVEGSLPGLVRMANLPLESTVKALKTLSSPDANSKSKVAEGRRVVEVERGWMLINYTEYRNMRDDQERREYNAKWMKEYRTRNTKKRVDSCGQKWAKCTQAETETETETKKKQHPSPSAPEIEQIYQAYPRHVGKGEALKAIKKALGFVDHTTLLKKVQAYAKCRSGQDSTYTPYPSKWFNERRWEDEPEKNRPEGPLAQEEIIADLIENDPRDKPISDEERARWALPENVNLRKEYLERKAAEEKAEQDKRAELWRKIDGSGSVPVAKGPSAEIKF